MSQQDNRAPDKSQGQGEPNQPADVKQLAREVAEALEKKVRISTHLSFASQKTDYIVSIIESVLASSSLYRDGELASAKTTIAQLELIIDTGTNDDPGTAYLRIKQALNDAKQRGYRAGVEAAAKVCVELKPVYLQKEKAALSEQNDNAAYFDGKATAASEIEEGIRSLLTTNPALVGEPGEVEEMSSQQDTAEQPEDSGKGGEGTVVPPDRIHQDIQESADLPWSAPLPPKCGWYFMRRAGEKPLAEGLIVWVGHNQSGVRYEGKFFYVGAAFLDRREFLGPITPEMVKPSTSDVSQNASRGMSAGNSPEVPEPTCTCFAPPTEQHATYCPREGMDYDPPISSSSLQELSKQNQGKS